jgi:flagellar hook protein FlgE
MKYIKDINQFEKIYESINLKNILLIRDLLKKRPIFKLKYIKEDNEGDEITVYDVDEGEFVKVSKAKLKELEDEYPELLEITKEIQNFAKEIDALNDTFEKFTDEMTETEGLKEALVVLRKFIKENGVLNSFKILTKLVKLLKKQVEIEKKVSNIIPKGEKYILNDGSKIGTLIVGGRPSTIENIINTITEALTIKNLTKILTGRTEDLEKLEVEYLKKDGKEASGELKDIEIKDNGDIVVSIENDKVGEIEKNLSEITGEAEGEDENALQKKMTDLIKNKPDDVKKVLKFVNFISDEKNKDKIDTIQKMIAKE